ncbi:MAG: hypothetical protein RJA22_1928 [Verrucomicrobiota bacterium]|jgi:O-antigen/teichoic acid export membrane protein
MPRLKRFTHSLASGYAALGANMLFTLASVPLALAYLSQAEFGLWALTAQAAAYLALIDLGMSGVSRILIDHKDEKAGGEYGGVIQTMLWVSVVQGAIILAASVGLGLGLREVLRIPSALEEEFLWLVLGQGVLLGLGFVTRLGGYILVAHQRYDILSYAQVISFGANFLVMWFGFHQGWGAYSLLAGGAASWAVGAGLCLAGCGRLRLLPPRGAWGRPSWARFRELFVYGRDIFLFFLGSQLVTGTQTLLVTRVLGLEAAAVWSICTRAFLLSLQLVYRLFDYSCAALAEMMVRQEWPRLQQRFKSLVVLSTSVAVLAAVGFAAGNGAFVQVWARGAVGWTPLNDVLLAAWLVVCVVSHAHVGLVGQTKRFGWLSYLYLAEGAVFVAASLLVLPRGGVTAMLAVSLAASCLFTLPYGLRRTSHLFGLSLREVAWGWSRPSLRLLLALGAVGAAAWAATRALDPGLRLALLGGLLGVAGAGLLLRLGTEESLRAELLERAPAWARPWLPALLGGGAPAPVPAMESAGKHGSQS